LSWTPGMQRLLSSTHLVRALVCRQLLLRFPLD
jgi:hypothetical protein